MRTSYILSVLFGATGACLADDSAPLRSAPLLDAHGPGLSSRIRNNIDVTLYVPADGVKRTNGIQFDLISEPDFGLRPAGTPRSREGQNLDFAK